MRRANHFALYELVFSVVTLGWTQFCFGVEPDQLPEILFQEPTSDSSRVAVPQANVVVSDSAVSVELFNASLRGVMEAIHQLSGIEIHISPEMESFTITDQFSGLPIEKALHRLLQGTSYALFYGKSNQGSSLSKVYVLPTRQLSSDTPGSRMNMDINPEAIAGEIDRLALPDEIKKELHTSVEVNNTIPDESLAEFKIEALSKLIEQLELYGSADSEVTREIKQQLQALQDQH